MKTEKIDVENTLYAYIDVDNQIEIGRAIVVTRDNLNDVKNFMGENAVIEQKIIEDTDIPIPDARTSMVGTECVVAIGSYQDIEHGSRTEKLVVPYGGVIYKPLGVFTGCDELQGEDSGYPLYHCMFFSVESFLDEFLEADELLGRLEDAITKCVDE